MQEIPDQIRTTRARPGGTGHLLYNTSWTLKQNGGALASILATDLYKTSALVPASPWLDPTPPAAPALTLSGNVLQIIPAAGESARWWGVRTRDPGGWTSRVLFVDQKTLTIDATVIRVLVQAVDQAGNASTAAEWRR